MPKTKISEFSSTAGNNTDIDGINIAEGCAPSGINDAIRELMAQLKDFQSGDAGDPITVVGTLAAKGTSSSGADLKLYEDTDNGTNYTGFKAPASLAADIQWTLPSADGTNGQALITNGSGTLSFTSVVGSDVAQTLNNKRINPRVSSTASTSSITPDIGSFDQYNFTALAAGLTINAPTGTPVDGNKLVFRILDNGTARALTWNATYTAIGVTLPTTTVVNKTTYVGCIYNANNTRWDVIAVTTQA